MNREPAPSKSLKATASTEPWIGLEANFEG